MNPVDTPTPSIEVINRAARATGRKCPHSNSAARASTPGPYCARAGANEGTRGVWADSQHGRPA